MNSVAAIERGAPAPRTPLWFASAKVYAPGGRRYNPGWHLALDIRNMLLVSECTARAALEREESRGGHTREDFPETDPELDGQHSTGRQAQPGAFEVETPGGFHLR